MIESLRSARCAPARCGRSGIRAIGAMADLVPRHQLAEITTLLDAPYANTFGATETGPAAGTAVLDPDRRGADRSRQAPELVLRGPPGRRRRPGGAGRRARRMRDPRARRCSAATGARPRSTPRTSAAAGSTWATCSCAAPDGRLDFVDRAKYMIKSGGENIYPAEIERVLLADPRVARRGRGAQGPTRAGARCRSRWSRATTSARPPTSCTPAAAPSSPATSSPRRSASSPSTDLPRSTTGKIQRHEVEAWLRTAGDAPADADDPVTPGGDTWARK